MAESKFDTGVTATEDPSAPSSTKPSGLAVEGTFADPEVNLGTDPRILKEFLAHVEATGEPATHLLVRPPNAMEGMGMEDRLSTVGVMEDMFGGMLTGLAPEGGMTGLKEEEMSITGVDGNDIPLIITSPEAEGPFPVVVHTHGGGMSMLRAKDAFYARWRRRLAAKGLIVVGVDFRNVGGSNGNHPFPAGLNDCWSTVQWVYDHLDSFPTTARPSRQIIVSGESGGGNLCIATAMKGCKEGKPIISGVYSMCPYVAGPEYYDRSKPCAKELPSLWENDGIMFSIDMSRDMSPLYTEDTKNPLAWPLFAGEEDLKGMPPTVISVNEVDPLRDEGRMMLRKLSAAGVEASGKVVMGTCHAGDMMSPPGSLTGEDTLNAIASFAAGRAPLP